MTTPSDITTIQTGATFARTIQENGTPPAGWRTLTGNSVINNATSSGSGYQAAVYINDTTKQIVIANAGTNGDWNDIASWPTVITGGISSQIRDVLTVGNEVKRLLTDSSSSGLTGYTVSTTGFSWGEVPAQIQASVFGWKGTGYDGPGAKAILDSTGFNTLASGMGITPVGKAADFISCNTAGVGPFGGSEVGDRGTDIAGARTCTMELANSTESGVLSMLSTLMDTTSPVGLGLKYAASQLVSTLALHSIKDIDAAVQGGKFQVADATSSSSIPATYRPFSFTDDEGNTLSTKQDTNGNVMLDLTGKPLLELKLNDAQTHDVLQVETNLASSHVEELTSHATGVETSQVFDKNDNLIGTTQTTHQTNTATSNDVLATKLQTLLDQNTSHDSQVLEAAEIRAVAGAQGKDEAWGGGRMLDVSDSHLGDYYWTNEHSSATDAPLATDTNTHGLGLVDGFDMGNGAGVYEPDNSGGSNGSNAWADNGGYSGDTTSWSDPGTSGGGYTGGGYVPPDIPYTPYDPGGYDYGGGYDYFAPVVLDMDGDGIELVAKADSRAWFDVKGDGQKHNIGWVGKDDAMLVIDDNKNGLVDQAKELSLALWTADTTDTDLQALKTVFDTNKDGVFNNQDARFADFKVWQDANGDGVTDAGELKTLAQAGIASINLTEATADLSTGGNHVAGFASYTTTAGAIKVVGDVGLGYDAQGWTASQDTSFVRMTESGGLVYGVAQSATLNLNLGSSNLDGVVGSTGNDTLAAGSKSAVMLQGGAGNDSLTGGAGDDWLQGDAGADTLVGGAGDDTLLIDQADLTSGRVDGGDGFDVAIITDDQATTMNLASKNLEAVVGGAGNDNFSTTATTRVILSGGAGNDTLSGGTAGDILFGGTGNDSLAGSAGSDIYVFNRGDGSDTITDSYSVQVTTTEWYNETVYTDYYPYAKYVRKQRTVTTTQEANAGSGDTLRLGSDIALEDIKLTASGADMVVGVLQNGVATTDQIILKNWTNVNARIEYIQTADGKSFAVADILAGTVNNDTLTGNANANMINGGTGADTLRGGAGDDTYVVDNASDIVTENVNEGTDTVRASVSYTLGTNIENLTLTGTAITNGTGNTLSNIIKGNSANNTLDGGSGADTMSGGAGDDTYIVDNTGDVVTEHLNEGFDTIQSSVTYTLGANLENLTLTGTAAVNGTGNELSNTLTGNSAANVLTAGAGNDVLIGGGGADTLVGGTGDDVYVVSDAATTITENANEGTDTVRSSVSYALAANVENLTLTGAAAINGTGNALSNTITGNAANNVLDGGAGVDTLQGGLGDDTYVVDNVGDVVTENLNEGTDTVQSYLSSYTLAANVENLQLMGAQGTGIGNSLANTITGTGGNDKLSGGFGNDTLIGGAGDDVLDGAIDQTIRFYSMTPTTGNGTAKVYLGAASEGATLTISGGVLPSVQAGQSIRYFGGAADESVYVTAGSTVDTTDLIASGGNDRVYLTGKFADYSQTVNENGEYIFTRINGLASGQSEVVKISSACDSDVLYFADGHVVMQCDLVQVTGTSLQDEVTYGFRKILQTDLLAGGTVLPANTPILSMGADSMSGGTGNDTYTIDDAGDVVTENLNEGTDTVQSYIGNYTLSANVENLQLMGVQNINGTGNSLANIITGNSGSNVLTGGAGADTFVFKTNIGSNNADTITDFSRADGDVIALSSAIFAKLMGKTNITNNYRLSNQAAVGGDDYIVYNASTGQLAYDVSGNGTTTATVFATLANKPQDLTAAQFAVI